MQLHIVSDLHLEDAQDPLYRPLLSLIGSASSGDRIVLAGDIFDLFVGDKVVFKRRYHLFFEAIEAAGRRGVLIDYIEGNHDFLLRRVFRGIPGACVHSSELRFEAGGKRFFISHGDRADRKDYGYRLLRFFFRSPVMRAFVALAPGSLIDWIGRSSSQYSRSQKPLLPEDQPQERREKLRKVYRNHAVEKLEQGFDYVVMGHCHDLDEMSFILEGRSTQYLNVGFPRTHGTILSWTPGSPQILRRIFGR